MAQTIHQLIAARALQGLGAALLTPGSLAIISASFSRAGARPRHRDLVRFLSHHYGVRPRPRGLADPTRFLALDSL